MTTQTHGNYQMTVPKCPRRSQLTVEEMTEQMFLINSLHVTKMRSGSKGKKTTHTHTHTKKIPNKQKNRKQEGVAEGLKVEKSRKEET